MQARKFNIGPVAMANSATNIANFAITSLSGPVGWTATQPLAYITRIRIVNKTAGAVTFSLYKGASGASAAGTEVVGTAKSIAANDAFEWYGSIEMKSTDFLVGLASAATSLTFECSGEVTFA